MPTSTSTTSSNENLDHNEILEFSVIVPAYNEEKGVAQTLEKLISILNATHHTYELVVVNDGSKDKTKEILENLNLDFKLINHVVNQGYGSALKTGIRNSTYENIVIIDADGTYPEEDVQKLFNDMKNYDMVVGARIGTNTNIPLVRKPAKWAINKLANYLAKQKIPDLNSGLRSFKKSIAMKFFNILPSGFSFTTTITLAMIVNGYNVHYIPINYLKRKGKSKIRPFRDTVNFIQLIIRTIAYFDPLRIFIPIAMFFFILTCFFGVRDLIFIIENGFGKSPGVGNLTLLSAVMTVIVLLIGLLADLIDKRLG